jgi:pimeloyl-ACP methyl ester carboxylesterase
MPTVRVNDVELYYERHGAGEPLLFISGLGGHLGEVPYLIESYRQHVQFIPYDNRGCGRSEKPAGEFTITGFADDTAALIDALGLKSAIVYGSSMGGMVAQELALRHPHRVRALILGCTTGGAVKGVLPAAETIQQMARNQALSGDEALSAGWRLGYSDTYIVANYSALLARSREASRYSAPPDSYMRQIVAAAKHDTWSRLHEITCPVMILHGAVDVMIPSANAHLLKQHIPHAELHILEGMGHGYNLEAQDQADALVLDFVRRQRTGSGEKAAHAVR